MRAKKKHELVWVKDGDGAAKGRHKRPGSSTFIVVVNRYPRRQLRPKDVGPVFILAGFLLAVAAKWLGIW